MNFWKPPKESTIHERTADLVKKIRLKSRRCWVLLATPFGADGQGGIDRLNDLIMEVMNQRAELKIVPVRLTTRGMGNLLLAQFIFAYALLKFIAYAVAGRADVLHLHLSIWGSAYRKVTLSLAAKLFRVPFIVHLNGSSFDHFWSTAPRYLGRSVDRLLLDSDRIIVTGRYWGSLISRQLPEVSGKIIVLPNATRGRVSYSRRSNSDIVQITSLGQLGERKGTPQLLEALSLLNIRKDWVATIAGDGKVEEGRARARELGIEDRVDMPGWLEGPAVDELLHRTDIFVLHSFAENQPVAIVEAFSHGIPVISTPVGAIPEVVDHNQNGLIVSCGDVRGLAAAIERLITDRDLRERFGQEAYRKFCKLYEVGPYAERLAEIWQSAMAQERSARRRSIKG